MSYMKRYNEQLALIKKSKAPFKKELRISVHDESHRIPSPKQLAAIGKIAQAVKDGVGVVRSDSQ